MTQKKQKNKVGRPRKFKCPQKMEADFKKYFKQCDKEGKPYTVSGLAVSIGSYRRELLKYEKYVEFRPIIKAAKGKIEKFLEETMMQDSKKTVACVFNLKANFGWIEEEKQQNRREVPKIIINIDQQDAKLLKTINISTNDEQDQSLIDQKT